RTDRSRSRPGLFLFWPYALVRPPLQLGVLPFPISAPIGLGDSRPALPTQIVEDGASHHRRAPVALHLLVGVEPCEEPLIERDLDRLHARAILCGLSIDMKIDIRRGAAGSTAAESGALAPPNGSLDPVEPRRVPPDDQSAPAR